MFESVHSNLLLDEFKAKEQEKDRKWETKRQEIEQEYQALRTRSYHELLPCLRKATPEDYLRWLKGFMDQGGIPTHNYNYPMARIDTFYVATQDFTLLPLCGTAALHIIVPRAYVCLGGEAGHCVLYFEDGYQTRGNLWIPVYSDLRF